MRVLKSSRFQKSNLREDIEKSIFLKYHALNGGCGAENSLEHIVAYHFNINPITYLLGQTQYQLQKILSIIKKKLAMRLPKASFVRHLGGKGPSIYDIRL